MEIRFEDFEIKKGYFACNLIEEGITPEKIFFSSSCLFNFSYDCIAYALSTLCGKKYDKIFFGLAISKKCKDNIEAFTNSTVCSLSTEELLNNKDNSAEEKDIILNFSGGLDSLAAYSLLPKDKTVLVSMDFGGWFKREADFFNLFNPLVIKTDFREKKYDRNSWTFMGVGSILASCFFNAKYNVFGTILEASAGFMKKEVELLDSVPFSYLGLKDLRVITGFTEVGTALLSVFYFSDDLIKNSLKSLAAPNSEKYQRKQLLISFANKFYSEEKNYEDIDLKLLDDLWGKTFATDFNIVYMLTKCKKDFLYEKIPSEVLNFCKTISGNFYERFNTNFVKFIPKEHREYIFGRMFKANILPYERKDFDELESVKNLLAKYYPQMF